MLLLSSTDKINVSKNCFRNAIRVSNGLDSDQDQHSGCKLFAKVNSR